MDIKNSVAIISGGASGMGAATARLLSQAGAKVALFDINFTAAKKTADEINGLTLKSADGIQVPYVKSTDGKNLPSEKSKNATNASSVTIDRIHALAIKCNVADENDVIEALRTVHTTLGPPRICINCAGIVHSRRLINKQGPMPLSEFQQIIDINLIGTFNVMRLSAAAMIPLDPIGENNERGIIINTASIAAFEGQIGQTAYSASKGAIVSLCLPAARELAQFGIRVMTIAPGLVDTPMFEKLSDETKMTLANSIPFPKRLARPEEYAQLVQHIIINSMLNGEVIRLDGALRMPTK